MVNGTAARALYARVGQVAGSVEAARWTLARIAHEAKTRGDVPEWAEVIGRHPRVRRASRTVREWASTFEFARAFRLVYPRWRNSAVTFSAWAALARKAKVIPWERLEELLDEWDTEGAGLESLWAQLALETEAPDGRAWGWYGERALTAARALELATDTPMKLLHATQTFIHAIHQEMDR